MQTILFVLVAIALYFVSDGIVRFAERTAGRRFENRTIIFFFTLLVLGFVTFWAIRRYAGA